MINSTELYGEKTMLAPVLAYLAGGIYENAKIIYREYIQNACDSIDEAVRSGSLPSHQYGRIEIWIDQNTRTVTIEDNGIGIPADDFIYTLTAIGGSEKHPDKHKGYKGIGRLCGLGYCTQLVFTSCVKGETVESILTYDAAKWRQMINAHINHEKQYTALEVLRETATFSRREIESAEFSFFRVELIGITKDNKDLLDKARVEEYLSFVAPVPYRNVFQLRTKIYEHAQNLGLRIDEYNVFYDGEPIYKEYKPTVVTSKGEDTIDDIGFHDIYYGDKLIAWMWYGITKFQAVLKPENKERSIRLRQNNIQVGIPDVLHEHAPFSEERGPHYFVGELFVVDTSLRLNAPRSYFEESPIRNELEQQLKFYFDINLTTIYKNASKIGSAITDIAKAVQLGQDIAEVQLKGQDVPEELSKRFDKAQQTASLKHSELTKLSDKISKKVESGEFQPADSVIKNIIGRVETPSLSDILASPKVVSTGMKTMPKPTSNQTSSKSSPPLGNPPVGIASRPPRMVSLDKVKEVIIRNTNEDVANLLIAKIEEEAN